MTEPLEDFAATQNPAGTVSALADMLERSGISVADIGRVNKVNAWQGFYKTASGEAEVVDLVGIQLVPTWADGPAWPVVAQAAPCVVKHRGAVAKAENVRRTVLLPDPQIGFYRLDDGTLVPMHDEQAMRCALQLIHQVRPHRIVNLGDFSDFAEWSSKFLVSPEFVLTTQPTVDRGHRFLAEQQAAAGPQLEQHDLLEGNHDDRVGRAIARNAMAALRLRRANTPEGWPVMSMPHLLRLDELGVTYHLGKYPAGSGSNWPGAVPGSKTPCTPCTASVSTCRNRPAPERQSTVQGHAHHFSTHAETYEYDADQPYEVEAWSLGCLLAGYGAVPSTHGSLTSKGQAGAPPRSSWQQVAYVGVPSPKPCRVAPWKLYASAKDAPSTTGKEVAA